MHIEDIEIFRKVKGKWKGPDGQWFDELEGVSLYSKVAIFECGELAMELNQTDYSKAQLIELIQECTRHYEMGKQVGQMQKINEIKKVLEIKT